MIAKWVIGDNGVIHETDPEPMKRVVAFYPSIKARKEVAKLLN